MAANEIKLLIAVAGIFFSFSYFAVLQEDVYKKEYGGQRFKSTFFALLLERSVNATVGALGIAALGGSKISLPIKEIFNSGVSQMFAMAASNEALRYVSYPTQVLGKSCKMVPVMVGGALIGGRAFSAAQYVQVALITGGVVVFNFGGKAKKGAEDSTYGLVLIAASLVLDAVTGGLQDKVKRSTKTLNAEKKGARPTMHESMFYTNASGALTALVLAVATGQLQDGIAFCTAQPQVLKAIMIYSLSSAVGQNFIYFTVTEFNPLVLTTVTTTRKIFSTLYSVFRNPQNSLSAMQWGGCALVFVGLLGEVLEKYLKSRHTAQKAPHPENSEKKKAK